MDSVPRVIGLRTRLGVVLLVALWLLATVHCGLETAVGVFASAEAEATGCCNRGGERCATDACDSIEGALYLSDAANPHIAAPQIVDNDFFSAAPAILTAPAGTGIIPADTFERAGDWTPSWQFVRRAAPLPRAPSVAIA